MRGRKCLGGRTALSWFLPATTSLPARLAMDIGREGSIYQNWEAGGD
jgi:hypothetical protein